MVRKEVKTEYTCNTFEKGNTETEYRLICEIKKVLIYDGRYYGILYANGKDLVNKEILMMP